MQYRKDKYGQDISALGYGCMRFSKNGASIDLDKTEREILYAIENGVNYFDTAYIYPGSEVALGTILERNGLRDKVKIATKLPQYLIKSKAGIDKYFNEHLTRLKTDHIDYYLMHMLTDIAAWEKLVSLGIKEWIAEKKASGQIINLGFSFHGNTEMFLKILDAYDWDFCQIQYNYLDENTQAGRAGLEAAYAKGIPVIIMEPLRGGKLVDLLPQKARDIIAASPRKFSAAEWSLRWLWNQPGVTCILSGMNSMDQVSENIRIADEAMIDSFSAEDFAIIEGIKTAIMENTKVGCTGCSYCMPCPKGIDIPTTFSCYNHMYSENTGTGRHEYLQMMAFQKNQVLYDACIECGKCESHCPQHIEIRKELKNAGKALMPWYYKLIFKAARVIKFW